MSITCSENLNARKKVLIVDDDSYMIRVLSIKLEKGGYEVITASNGEAGLEKIKTCKPNVVISDVCMPKMNGWNMCRKIISYAEVQPDLIIIMTSMIEREEREKIKLLPNALFVPKPISPKNILMLIQQQYN